MYVYFIIIINIWQKTGIRVSKKHFVHTRTKTVIVKNYQKSQKSITLRIIYHTFVLFLIFHFF